jgi:hypothetical protein
MQVTRTLVAALLSFAAAGTMAHELEWSQPEPATTSQRTREAVRAEAQNARAQGPSHWASGGELSEATPAISVRAAPAPTREQVKAQLAAARAAHELPRYGEL